MDFFTENTHNNHDNELYHNNGDFAFGNDTFNQDLNNDFGNPVSHVHYGDDEFNEPVENEEEELDKVEKSLGFDAFPPILGSSNAENHTGFDDFPKIDSPAVYETPTSNTYIPPTIDHITNKFDKSVKLTAQKVEIPTKAEELLKEKNELEAKRKQEIKEQAKQDIQEFYKQRESIIARKKANNRLQEERLEKENANPDTPFWVKVCNLIDFNTNKKDKEVTNDGKQLKDLTKMKQLLLQLKATPNAPC